MVGECKQEGCRKPHVDVHCQDNCFCKILGIDLNLLGGGESGGFMSIANISWNFRTWIFLKETKESAGGKKKLYFS